MLFSEAGEIISDSWDQLKHKNYVKELSGNLFFDDGIQEDQEKILVYEKIDREILKVRKKRETTN